jgi:ubiquitin-protein ligase
MGDEIFAVNYQELLQMGFSDEIALEALGCCPDLQSAIDFIYSKSSEIGDVKQILYNYDEPAKNHVQTAPFVPGPPQSLPKPKVSPPIHYLPNQSVPFLSSSNSGCLPPLNPNHPQNNPNPIITQQGVKNYQQSFPGPMKFGYSTTENSSFPVNNFPQNLSNFSGPAPSPSSSFQPMPYPPPQFPNYPPSINNVNFGNQFPNPINPAQAKPFLNPQPIPSNPFQAPMKFTANSTSSFSPFPQVNSKNPLENESYHEFLFNCLQLRGTNELDAFEICSSCSCKEEALLILEIPMSYKDTPFSEIPQNLITGEGFEDINSKEDIKKELIKSGASPKEAESLSSIYKTLPEALQAFFNQESDLAYKSPYKPPPPAVSSLYLKKPAGVPSIPKPSKHSIPPMPPNPFLNFSNSSSSYSSSEDLFSYSNRYPKSKPVVMSAPSESDPVAPDVKTNYFESLQNYRLVMSESPEVFRDFNLGQVASSGAAFTKRMNVEMKTIKTTVPCDSTASIFTLIDSECMHRIKFLLSGTIDTPYAHGLYLFDVLLPSNYPNAPPKVNIKTTGNGIMRFNPNLYSNGYVCLSIINTWSGRPEEQWNPSSSTMLQVMLSIQSLVMDSNIIQKEPGFVNLAGNSAENIGYQVEVKYGNLKYAMIENLKNPPAGFRDVVLNHFRCKKNEILATAKLWTEEVKNLRYVANGTQNQNINQEINQKTPFIAFNELLTELNNLLRNL